MGNLFTCLQRIRALQSALSSLSLPHILHVTLLRSVGCGLERLLLPLKEQDWNQSCDTDLTKIHAMHVLLVARLV